MRSERELAVRPLMPPAVLPAVLAVLGVLELAITRPAGWHFGVAVEVAACALLVLRRRNALVFATLGAVLVLLNAWVGPALSDASVPIAVLTLPASPLHAGSRIYAACSASA
jgi:hypothetical protein